MELQIKLSPEDMATIAGMVVERLRASEPEDAARKQLYTEQEAAESLSISLASLKRWRLDGQVRAATTRRPILYGKREMEAVKAFLANRSGASN